MNIVYCVSRKDNFSGMFPLVRDQLEDGSDKYKLRLIKNEGNCRMEHLRRNKGIMEESMEESVDSIEN